MARSVKIRRREALPGGGFDSAGNPKQGKRKVVGQLAVTTYTNVGESLTPADLGLSVIDFISIKHENEAGASEGAAGRVVRYNYTTSDFYIIDGIKPAGATHTLYFQAEGDALDGIELV